MEDGSLPSGRTVLAAVGFGCFLSLQTYYGLCYALPLAEGYSFDAAIMLRIVSVAALVLAMLVCVGRANWVLDNLSGILPLGMALGCVPFAYEIIHITLGFALPDSVIMMFSGLAWVCFGVSFLILGQAWCCVLSQTTMRQSLGIIAASAAASVLFYSGVSAIKPVFMSMAGTMVILVIGYVLAMVLVRSDQSRTEAVNREFSEHLDVQEIAWHTVYNVLYAFMLLAAATQGLLAVIIVGSCGIFGAGLALFTGSTSFMRIPDSGRVYQATLPLVVVLFLLLPYCEGWGIVVCASITVSVNSFATLLYWCESTSQNAEFNRHPIRYFALYSQPKWSGMLIGSILGYLVFVAHVFEGRALGIFSIALAGILLLCFVLFSMSAKRKEDAVNEKLAEGAPVGEVRGDNIEDACAHVACEGGLSPREAEVLLLLAKGRNARYIQENLFIGLSTARSHIYHIYQKLGVSSQQELIDMVERAASSH